jgi:His-Xaa-Ser system radical SAM maturase HxsB
VSSELPAVFSRLDEYAVSTPYIILPFNFLRLENENVLLTNLAGEYLIISNSVFELFIQGRLSKFDSNYKNLLSKHLAMEADDRTAIELLNIKVQNKVDAASNFTGLHIFVVTLRCDHSCQYCQVSRQNSDIDSFDMSEQHADIALDWVFKTPNQNVKIEFQGGESLLNFKLIKHITLKALELNLIHKKNLQFVIATNLVFLSDEIIKFADQTGIFFSTSLDGPSELHNSNRPRPDRNSYELAISGINRIRSDLGFDRVSALMTTTHRSIPLVRDIIDTYIKHGFAGIFLRPLSPFGFATKTKLFSKYSQTDWLDFYETGLDYIIELNKSGVEIQEYYTTILVRKMLTTHGTGYVDLQNPSGSAIGAVVFNYDGRIFASDEGRMLAEMGNDGLEIGNLQEDSYDSVFTNGKLISTLKDTMLECSPMCSDCVYQNWCGVDIAHHMATQNDKIGHKAFSSFCTRHMGMFKIILSRMDRDTFTKELLEKWAWR